MNKLIQLRKVCQNCKASAMHTNRIVELVNYGSVTYGKKIACENCGHESSVK